MTNLFLAFVLCMFSIFCHAKVPTMVSSISPVNALVDGVTAGVTTSTLLVPPNVSHHHYSLKPSDAMALQNATVVVWLGHSLETFLEKPIANLSNNTTIITIEELPKLTLYPLRSNKNWEHSGHDHAHHSNIDPHLWLDPQNAIIIIRAIANTLSKIDADHAKLYQANADSMITKINELDKKLMSQLKPIKDKSFLVFHDGYQYFEKHYQLTGDAGSIAMDSELPPSAQRLYQLHQLIEQKNIKCLFAEPTTSSAIIQTLQRDAKNGNITVGELDSMGKGHLFADYLNLLQFDADQLTMCLR